MNRQTINVVLTLTFFGLLATLMFIIGGCTTSRDMAKAESSAGACVCITSKCESSISMSGVSSGEEISRAVDKAMEISKQEESAAPAKRR